MPQNTFSFVTRKSLEISGLGLILSINNMHRNVDVQLYKLIVISIIRFRHVVLPKELVRLVPKTHLMSESEWRAIGVQQSRGWIHYMIHKPEPHILLFRRPKTVTNGC